MLLIFMAIFIMKVFESGYCKGCEEGFYLDGAKVNMYRVLKNPCSVPKHSKVYYERRIK